jgi:hypothetical protein
VEVVLSASLESGPWKAGGEEVMTVCSGAGQLWSPYRRSLSTWGWLGATHCSPRAQSRPRW